MKPAAEMSLRERADALQRLRSQLLERSWGNEYVQLVEDAAQLYRQLNEAATHTGRLYRLVLEQDG